MDSTNGNIQQPVEDTEVLVAPNFRKGKGKVKPFIRWRARLLHLAQMTLPDGRLEHRNKRRIASYLESVQENLPPAAQSLRGGFFALQIDDDSTPSHPADGAEQANDAGRLCHFPAGQSQGTGRVVLGCADQRDEFFPQPGSVRCAQAQGFSAAHAAAR